jgi:hypothetical protein
MWRLVRRQFFLERFDEDASSRAFATLFQIAYATFDGMFCLSVHLLALRSVVLLKAIDLFFKVIPPSDVSLCWNGNTRA